MKHNTSTYIKYTLVMLSLIFITGLSGCFINNCELYVPQKWHIGTIEAEFNAPKQVLKIGDTIQFIFKLDKNLKDTADQLLNIDLGVKVFNKISTTEDPNNSSNNDALAVDTTIFNVFDEYFETKIIKGDPINAYTFNCQLTGDKWELEVTYIVKKAGSFWAFIKIEDIYTSSSDLGEGVCMSGDIHTFGAETIWKENYNNRIEYLFNDQAHNYPNYFGFIVEE